MKEVQILHPHEPARPPCMRRPYPPSWTTTPWTPTSSFQQARAAYGPPGAPRWRCRPPAWRRAPPQGRQCQRAWPGWRWRCPRCPGRPAKGSGFVHDIFQLFHLHTIEGQFLLPQRANNGKREFSQPNKWMRQKVFSTLGNQSGPFASLYTPFVKEIFHLFHFHTGRPILITPRGAILGKGNSCHPKSEWVGGFQCLGQPNSTICIPLNLVNF